MDIYVTDKVSNKFYETVKKSCETFPEYYSLLKSPIILGDTLHDIDPNLSEIWRDIAMLYRPSSGQIFLAEHYGDEKCTKNGTILGGIAHESGHYFDHRVFGNSNTKGNFSTNRKSPFLKAWKNDLENLKMRPDKYMPLGDIFLRYMESDGGSGTRETFAEIWANSHGQSGMWHWGIDDIRLFWPECTEIVENCIASLD